MKGRTAKLIARDHEVEDQWRFPSRFSLDKKR